MPLTSKDRNDSGLIKGSYGMRIVVIVLVIGAVLTLRKLIDTVIRS